MGGVGLGIGFASIYAIALLVEGRSHWWPLIPAAALTASGLVAGNEAMERAIAFGWPLILVAAGLVVLAKGRLLQRR